MSLLMTKKKKTRLEEARKQKELQAKITVKRTLNQMRNQLNKLIPYKKSYIAKAKEAVLVNNQQAYALSKSGLKALVAKQRFLESMIMNFELAVETNEMNKIIESFVQGINIISSQLQEVTSSVEMTKAQQAYDQAIANNASQYEALQSFLESTSTSFESMEIIGDNISDEEIDRLINNDAADYEANIDKAIDEKLSSIREKMENV
ncbi:hypothetical protein [Liberiplasma polymorphum]|uniref:hypothetical protein n=1 Tax=Liberiplasma polymorphum TaxID=3374570 RepID=UPI003773D228